MAIDLSQATENPTVDQSDLAALLPGFPYPDEGKDSTILLTLGFTVTNIREKIDASLLDADLLGWFIKFGSKKPDGTINSTQQIASLEIMKLFVRGPIGGRRYLDTSPLNGVAFVPQLISQKPTPSQAARNLDYDTALSKTELSVTPIPTAPCNLLTHHTSWAEATFFRRSDLRYLRMYISTFPATYNDFIFTGAKVNYDIMHDPPLRNNQFSLPGGPLNGMVPDSSKAFTLKAEPFYNPLVSTEPTPPDVPLMDELAPWKEEGDIVNDYDTQLPDSDLQSSSSKPGSAFPVAAMALPCPDYWEVMEEVVERIGPSSEAEFVALMTRLNDGLSTSGIEGLTQNPVSLTQGNGDWIMALLNLLIDTLTR